MKNIFRNLHLYLSLAAGVFIMIACVTGSIMVFEEDIEHTLHCERYFIEKQNTQLPLDKLITAAEKNIPNSKASAIKIYQDSLRTAEINLSIESKIEAKEKGKSTLTAFLNPYNGKIIAVYNKRESFFFKVEMLHRFLLGKKGGIGQYVMGYSAFFFLFILVSGIILWWPKTKSALSQRLKIKWDGNGKRLLRDLHTVTGFYTSIFLLVMVITGLVMSFKWVNNGLFVITTSKIETPKPPQSVLINQPTVSTEKVNQLVKNNFKKADFYTVKIPKDALDIFTVLILEKGNKPNQLNTYYMDQYHGNMLGQLRFSEKNLGQRIRSYIKPIHTGELFGMPSKILSFIICLLTLTFPVTGVMMWLNRLKKRKADYKLLNGISIKG